MTSGTWDRRATSVHMAPVHPCPVIIMKNHLLSLGVAGIALVLSSTAAPAQGLAERRVVASLPQLDARIDAARRAYDTPALAVGIVSGRRLVHFRGFGAKDAGGRPPDVDTAFRVGSTTKAFVGALLGQQVEQGRLSWSDRVVDIEPGFRLADPAATRDFQVVDLLAQRSGLPPYALGYMLALNYRQEAMVRGLAHVSPVAPFRTAFAYQNALHSVAGRIVAHAAGAPDWAEVLRRDLLIPLGMFGSSLGQAAYLGNAEPGGGLRDRRLFRPPPTGAYRLLVDRRHDRAAAGRQPECLGRRHGAMAAAAAWARHGRRPAIPAPRDCRGELASAGRDRRRRRLPARRPGRLCDRLGRRAPCRCAAGLAQWRAGGVQGRRSLPARS